MKKHALKTCIFLLLALCLCLQACHTKTRPESTDAPKPSASVPVQTESDPVRTDPVPATETVQQTDPVPTTEAPETQPFTEPTELPTDPTEVPPSGDPALIRYQNGGYRDYLDDIPVNMVDFSQMEYVRPDVESLYADFAALTADAADTDDAEELLSRYYALYDRYVDFYTMDTLSNIRYSLNTKDSYFKTEYDFCEEETPNVEEKLEALYKAFAASPARYALEDAYFGEGYFLQYDDYEVYTNETYLRLSQEEKRILSEYRDLTADPQIEFNGETQSVYDLLESDDYSTYIAALKAYYEQYNPLVGEKYVELIRIRKQLAETLEYESYADYSYAFTYGRDYTPEQGSAFVDDIETWLVPIYKELRYDPIMYGSSYSVKEKKVHDMVLSAAEEIGGAVYDAFRFMEAYHLYDITQSPDKLDSSFQTYIYSYEAPYVFVNSTGSSSDYTTFAHEFGHFTDAYHNYSADEDLETAETFSQSMEFLSLCYTKELTARQRESLLESQLADVLMTYISQASFARFEESVYALPEDELTVERVNSLYLEANKAFAISEYGYDFYYAKSWIDVIHFFEVPYYVISYCVSADNALQVYQLEAAEKGAGVDAYFRLLDRDYEAGVQQVMEDAGLSNPFDEGRMEQTAEFFREAFDLE